MKYLELHERQLMKSTMSNKQLAKFVSNVQAQLLVGLRAMSTFNEVKPSSAPIGIMSIFRTARELAQLLKKVEKHLLSESTGTASSQAFVALQDYSEKVKNQANTLRDNIHRLDQEDEKVIKIAKLVLNSLNSLDTLAKSLDTFCKKVKNSGTKKNIKKKGILAKILS